ncbi:MAG TPA: signal peptidase I [Ktedonobacteraceae bacterium]|nr:signal peptidase I [Ktedonobacteraceae bacterium]
MKPEADLTHPESDGKRRYRLLRDIAETVALTLLMFLVIRFAVQNFNIDGTSMEPNLHNRELVLVDKWTYLFHPPARGDVIVFKAPPDPTQDYVKRVIGVPGDRITVQGTTVVVDGVVLNEKYIAAQYQGVPPGTRAIKNLEIPANQYFVLGDNRAVSSDSRIWGFVPKQNIIGRAAFVYWPLGQNNNGFMPGVSTVFASIRQNNNQGSGPLSVITSNINAFWLLIIPVLILAFRQRKTVKRWLLPAPKEKTPQET